MYLLPLIFSLLSMFSVATFWSPVATASPSPTKQNDPSIIEGADAYLKAVLVGDARAVAAMFDDDAMVMPPNQQLLRGKLAMARGDLAKAAEQFERSLAQARALSMRPVCEACEAGLAAIAALQSTSSVQRNVEV